MASTDARATSLSRIRVGYLLLLPIALATGCAEPAGPRAAAEQVIGPSLAAVQERGEGVLDGSGTFFLPCLGEAVQVQSLSPFTYHRTVTPSGNIIFTDHFIPGASTGTAVGLTSGTTWTLERVSSPEVIRVTAGEMSRFTANIWWVSDTGPDFNIHSNVFFSQNARGEVVAERVEIRCIVH